MCIIVFFSYFYSYYIIFHFAVKARYGEDVAFSEDESSDSSSSEDENVC